MSTTALEFRKHLSLNDLHFITQALGADSLNESNALFYLLTDPNTVDSVLDLPELLQIVLNEPTALSLSPRLYFYLLTRHSLKNAGINSAELADYISSVLESFLKSDFQPHTLNNVFYVVDWLQQVEVSPEGKRYNLYISAGNHLLFLTGIFPQFIHKRTQRKGAPDINFYETIGRHSYLAAAQHPLNRHSVTQDVYARLAESFTEVRHTLNQLADRLITVN